MAVLSLYAEETAERRPVADTCAQLTTDKSDRNQEWETASQQTTEQVLLVFRACKCSVFLPAKPNAWYQERVLRQVRQQHTSSAGSTLSTYSQQNTKIATSAA